MDIAEKIQGHGVKGRGHSHRAIVMKILCNRLLDDAHIVLKGI